MKEPGFQTDFYKNIHKMRQEGGNVLLSKKYAKIDKNICVACGACTKECPKSAISVCKVRVGKFGKEN